MKNLNTNKQVGISEKAHERLNKLSIASRKNGTPLSKGAIASKLILNAWEKEAIG